MRFGLIFISIIFCMTIFLSCGEKTDSIITFPSNIDNSYCKDKKSNTPYAGGIGTVDNPYTICTANQFNQIAIRLDYAANTYFKVMEDIDFSGFITYTIGTDVTFFNGVFDGNNYELKNIYVFDELVDKAGLFITTGSTAQLRNIKLTNAYVKGFIGTGGLVSTNYGVIENCSVFGIVYGYPYNTGGLVGDNYNIISNSYVNATVTGNSHIGGLVGRNLGSGIINNSSSSSTVVIDGNCSGDILGSNTGTATDLSFTGTVSLGQSIGCLTD